MRKIVSSLIASLFLVSTAYAEIGVNIGISGTAGLYGATAKETHKVDNGAVAGSTAQDTEIAAAGYGSIFIEKTFGDRFAIGIDYVPTAFESETAETSKKDITSGVTVNTRTNTVQVDLEELTTLYVTFDVTDSTYVKAGYASIDVITNESLGTGSTYRNASLDGSVLGIGTEMDMGGFFIRAEGNYTDFDGTSLSSNDNIITLKSLQGVSGVLSVGKSF